MLKAKSGIVSVESLPQRDGDAYTYMIESEVGVDIRKNLFFSLAEKKWPLIGLESLGMSLEDIFITIVDQTTGKSRYEKRKKPTKANAETELAKQIVDKSTQKSESAPENKLAALFGEEPADKND